jgi:hypothetical protein
VRGRPMAGVWQITWPLNWMGTAIGIVLVFIPTLAATVTPRFLGGPNGALYGNILEHQFGATGTWALGSAGGIPGTAGGPSGPVAVGRPTRGGIALRERQPRRLGAGLAEKSERRRYTSTTGTAWPL